MSNSSKYPGLCKPYEVEQNAANEYAELNFNSISAQQPPSSYFTYKTYNSQYDNARMVGTSSSTRNNVPSPFANRNHNAKANNEVHSYSQRREPKTTNQQQYGNQRAYQPNSQSQQPRPQTPPTPSTTTRYQMSPFQQAFASYQEQQQQKRPIDKNNPFHTYRWNLLFKNYLWMLCGRVSFLSSSAFVRCFVRRALSLIMKPHRIFIFHFHPKQRPRPIRLKFHNPDGFALPLPGIFLLFGRVQEMGSIND